MIFGLSIGTVLSIASSLLKLANYFFGQIRDNSLEKVGEDREKLRQYAELDAVSRALKDIDARYASMSNEEIKADIAAKGDFRD
jgi:hypothetical protein